MGYLYGQVGETEALPQDMEIAFVIVSYMMSLQHSMSDALSKKCTECGDAGLVRACASYQMNQ